MCSVLSSWKLWSTAVQHAMSHSSCKALVSSTSGVGGTSFFADHFKAVKGIWKVHHFIFDSTHPGVVVMKSTLDGPTTELQLLKSSKEVVCEAGLPAIIQLQVFFSLSAKFMSLAPY